jgi:hypothetical protein
VLIVDPVRALSDKQRLKKQEGILRCLRVGASRRDAFTFVGISPDTFNLWLDQVEFANAVAQAEAAAVINHITRIAHSAASGNWQAAAWWLERKRPHEYGKKAQLDLNLGEMSPDDIKRYIAERLGLLEPAGAATALPEVTIRGELARGGDEGEEPLRSVSE